jgi:hypothetical protein
MERSISNRKSLLEREKELLLKEEAELERQRQLLRSRGNSIIGVIDDQEENSNPFTGSFVLDAQASNESLSTKNISSALSDKSDLDSWSDIHEIQVMRQRSDSSESFESIHHHQL